MIAIHACSDIVKKVLFVKLLSFNLLSYYIYNVTSRVIKHYLVTMPT